jgi:hypothetical protein
VYGILLGLCAAAAQAQTDREHIGINNSNRESNLSLARDYVKRDLELGVGAVRSGMDGVGGRFVGAPFDFAAKDAVVDLYRASNLTVHTVVHARYGVDHHGNNATISPADYETWMRNFDYYVRGVMQHYRGRIFHYIVENEPELHYPGSGGWLTARQAVDFTRIAFRAARDIDPMIRIESPPTNTPESPTLREMLELGLADWCDYIGVHAYGSQIDDNRFANLWTLLAEFKIRKPVCVSECGANPDWAPPCLKGSEAGRLEYQRRFFYQLQMQMKRFGVSHTMLYTIQEQPDDLNILNRPAYDEVKNHFRLSPLANGGFEEANDSEHGWVPNFSNAYDGVVAPDNVRCIRDDAVNARSGSGYARLSPAAAQSLRRVVAVPANAACSVSAWVRVSGQGRARLRALGFDPLDGDAEVAVVSTSKPTWEQLVLRVTPTNPWVVIDLSCEGDNTTATFDDVVITAP